MRFFFLGLFCFLVGAVPLRAQAATVTATITGTVYSGTNCYSGATGCVFGLTHDLAQEPPLPFTLVFTFNESQGSVTGTPCTTNTPPSIYSSEITGASNTTGNPGSAVLTITDADGNPWPFNIVGSSYPEGTTSSYADRLYSGLTGCHGSEYVLYNATADYTPSGSGYSEVNVQLWPGTFPTGYLSTSGDWRTAISSETVRNYPQAVDFTIEHYNGTEYDAYAYGYLTPQTYSVTGPACDFPVSESTAFDQWGPPYLTSDPNDPTIGGWQQTLTDINPTATGFNNTGFSGATVEESTAAPGVDACYNNALAAGFTPQQIPFGPNTGVTGGTATVSTYGHWYDSVGYSSQTIAPGGQAVQWFQANLPSSSFPCGFTLYQKMQFQCSSGGSFNDYGQTNTGHYNTLQSFINDNKAVTDVTSVRSGHTQVHP